MKQALPHTIKDHSSSIFMLYMVVGAPLCVLLIIGGFIGYALHGGAIDQLEGAAIFKGYYPIIVFMGYIILAPQVALTAALIIHCVKERGFVTYGETFIAATLSISLPMLLSGFMIWKWILAIGAVWIATSLLLRVMWCHKMGRNNVF